MKYNALMLVEVAMESNVDQFNINKMRGILLIKEWKKFKNERVFIKKSLQIFCKSIFKMKELLTYCA